MINPVDTLIRSGRWPTLMPLPFVTGRDLVGTVTAASAGSGFYRVTASGPQPGYAGRQGTCAERAVVPGAELYPLPDGAAATEAAAAFHLPRLRSLACTTGPAPGRDRRSSSEGRRAVSDRRWSGSPSQAGLRVIATARPSDDARCLEQGASTVFDFGDPSLAGRVLDAVPGGADIHWDTSGRMPLNVMEPMTASGGKIIVTAGAEPQPPKTSLLPILPGTSA